MVDQLLEMAKCLAQFISKSLNFPIEDDINDASLLSKTILESYPMMGDMCWAYSIENDHLFTKNVRCGL